MFSTAGILSDILNNLIQEGPEIVHSFFPSTEKAACEKQEIQRTENAMAYRVSIQKNSEIFHI